MAFIVRWNNGQLEERKFRSRAAAEAFVVSLRDVAARMLDVRIQPLVEVGELAEGDHFVYRDALYTVGAEETDGKIACTVEMQRDGEGQWTFLVNRYAMRFDPSTEVEPGTPLVELG